MIFRLFDGKFCHKFELWAIVLVIGNTARFYFRLVMENFMVTSEPHFKFTQETTQTEKKQQCWKILTVEDDHNYQSALLNSFKAISIDGDYQLELLTAQSVAEAASILSIHKDIALVFIDVVMEEDDSGLRLVDTIRNVIGNGEMRIVLLTGQPSFAPERQVMESLDIDEYWNKSDINIEKLQSIVTSNLRTYNYIAQISNAKSGLQLVLDAARSINSKHDLRSFSQAVLEEIGKILKISEGGGVLCSGNSQSAAVPEVISTSGCFKNIVGRNLTQDIIEEQVYLDVQTAIKTKQHVFTSHYSVFYFDTHDIDINHYITIVKSVNPIDEQNIYLLRVFSENVSTGFSNIALLNRLTELAYADVTLNMPNRNWLQREIENMNTVEQQATQLLVFEILQYDEKLFSFGFDYCKKLVKSLQRNIRQQFAGNQPRIALFNKDALGVLIANDIQFSQQVINGLIRQTFKVDGVTQLLDVKVLAVDLSYVAQNTPAQIFNLAESTLNDDKSKAAEFIRFTSHDSQALTRRYTLLQQLRTAIRKQQLTIALQPKVDLQTREPVGFEALARWQLEDGSFVRPDEFIELAETAGLINVLDKQIFDQILIAINTLRIAGFELPISFNASTYDLLSQSYFDDIAEKIASQHVNPHLLELEVTETQAIYNYEKINRCLQRFADLGLKISIDDFGTGYSSLAHIAEIPAHAIKIDRCFVSNLRTNKSSEHIIEMIIMLADKFNFEVIAEGVETEFEHDWLASIGCNKGQGYLYAKPMFIDDVLSWLESDYGRQ